MGRSKDSNSELENGEDSEYSPVKVPPALGEQFVEQADATVGVEVTRDEVIIGTPIKEDLWMVFSPESEKHGFEREAMIGDRELAFTLILDRYQQLDWGVPDEVFVYDSHGSGDGKKHQQVTDLAGHVREPILSPY